MSRDTYLLIHVIKHMYVLMLDEYIFMMYIGDIQLYMYHVTVILVDTKYIDL